MVNFLVICKFPIHMSSSRCAKIKNDSKYYVWEEPHVWKFCVDQVFRRCVPESNLNLYCGGHSSPKRTTWNVVDCGLFWSTLFVDAYSFCKSCEKCQKFGSLQKINEMPLNSIMICEVFHVWGMDFIGPFSSSVCYLYILLLVIFISFLLLTMCRSGWRQSSLGLTQLLLFQDV